jgi:hypothetical protein
VAEKYCFQFVYLLISQIILDNEWELHWIYPQWEIGWLKSKKVILPDFVFFEEKATPGNPLLPPTFLVPAFKVKTL